MHGHFGVAIESLLDDLADIAVMRPGMFLIAHETSKQAEIFVRLHGLASVEPCVLAVTQWWDHRYPPCGGHAGIRSAALIQAIGAHVRHVGGGGS